MLLLQTVTKVLQALKGGRRGTHKGKSHHIHYVQAGQRPSSSSKLMQQLPCRVSSRT